jgi:hypothetical protein
MTVSLEVRVDDRLRLAGSLLAAGAWPEQEQTVRPYKPHRVAEGARRLLAEWCEHPAVVAAGALAGQPGQGDGAPLFAAALAEAWPAGLDEFTAGAQPAEYWSLTQAHWQAAKEELGKVLARADLAHFLSALFGRPQGRLVVAPNLLFPGQAAPTVAGPDGSLWLCLPPPSAWGASPPWRYDERPDEVLGVAAEALARALIEAGLVDERVAQVLRLHAGVVGLAAAVLFLREAEGEAAGDQFMLMEQRGRRLPKLPEVVEALAESAGLAKLERLLNALPPQP